MKWKLVPEEPTEEMGDAGIEAWKAGRSNGTYVDDCYKAMLAAAPQPDYDAIKIFPNFKDFEDEVVFNLLKPHVDGHGADTTD